MAIFLLLWIDLSVLVYILCFLCITEYDNLLVTVSTSVIDCERVSE